MNGTPASAARLDRAATDLVRRIGRRDVSAMATVSAVSMVTAATLSGNDTVASVLVALGAVLGAPAVWRHRDDLFVRLAVGIAATWLVYGALVGSLPSVTDPSSMRSFISTEGRVLVVIATMAFARGVRNVGDYRSLLRLTVWIVTAAHVFALVMYVLDVSVLGFPIRLGNGLFKGLSSSHHVVGFVATVVIIVVWAVPGWFTGAIRWLAPSVALVSIVVAGSRSSVLGLLAGGAVIIVHRYGWRRAGLVALALAVLATPVVAVNERLRTTVDVVTRPEFTSEVREAWGRGTLVGIRDLSDSAAEANFLIRVALWGIAWQRFEDSPLIGIGSFRQNDGELEYSGRRGVVWVATSANNRYNDAEPHNVALYLLSETGVAGLVLYSTPYFLAWRRMRLGGEPEAPTSPDQLPLRADIDQALRLLVVSMIATAAAISMVSSGVLATGLGLAVNAVVFSAVGLRSHVTPHPRIEVEA